MNKKIIILISIIIAIGVTFFIAMYYKKEYEKVAKILLVEIDTDILIEEILNDETIAKEIDGDSLVEIDDENYSLLYNIDTDLLESYYGKMPMISLKANEFVVVKVKDIESISIIEEAFRNRASDIASNFKDYLETEYEISSDPLIYSKGKYVIFAISSNTDLIKDIFESNFYND